MKKKLLITVGAGASIDFGLPSVGDVDNLLDITAGRLYPLASIPDSNLYCYCRDLIQAYYSQAPKPGLRKWVNFEEVIYQLNLLAHFHSDTEHLLGANALLTPKPLPAILEFGRTHRIVDGNILRQMAAQLLDAVVDEFIDVCAGLAARKSLEIAQLTRFLAELGDEFDIGIVTLNYMMYLPRPVPACTPDSTPRRVHLIH